MKQFKKAWVLNQLKLFVACMTGMITVSCTDYMEDYTPTNDETSVKIQVVDQKIMDYDAITRTAYSGITTSFENGDTIGIYAVQGTTVKYANIKATYYNGEWTPESFIKFSRNYTYYAYFPYRRSPSAPDFTQATVDTKFATLISGWSIAADQSSDAAFKASDLMLAQGTNPSENVISFQMNHKMSMAILEMENCTMSYSTTPDVKTPIGHTFTGNIPLYDSSDGKYYYIMRPNTLTTIGGVSVRAGAGKYIQRRTGDITDTYTITYSTDGGSTYSADSKPSWLTSIVETRGEGETLNFCIYATDTKTTNTSLGTTTVNPSQDVLRTATPVNQYDLSTKGGTISRTTANCYMIHAPGTYKLPLVYGNSIKNGGTNSKAYAATSTGTNIKANLVNHADNPITGPWLKDHVGAVPSTAELLWQDASGLISEVGISGDYLTFTVPAATITAGNAVIAVKNSSGNIVWSWHIWVTDQDWSRSLTTVATGAHNYIVTPVNVGWVPGDETRVTYKGSNCLVRVTTNSGSQLSFRVDQPNNVTVTARKDGFSPYYQWGRKDPFIPSNGGNGSSANKTVYDISGNDITSTITPQTKKTNATTTKGGSIQNPTMWYYSGDLWESETYYNNWDINNNLVNNIATATEKTVYDPCPPGFCVPTDNLYNFMGDNSSRTMTTFNTTIGSKGATWNIGITGDALFFPASGYRDISNGSLSLVGSSGLCWSASVYNSNYVYYLYFDSSIWRWRWNTLGRGNGFSVRAVVEE